MEWDVPIRNRKINEGNSRINSGIFFFLQSQVRSLFAFEHRDDNINSGLVKSQHLIFQPVAASGSGHNRELGSNPVKAHYHCLIASNA